MRTTLDLDPDVLQAAKEIAQKERTTAGQIISKLVRQALVGSKPHSEDVFVYKNGLPVLASRGEIITLEHVQQIMDEEGI